MSVIRPDWVTRHSTGDSGSCDACQNEKMNRALAVTLTVAMVGGLLAMGAAGNVAADEHTNVDDGVDFDFDLDIGDTTAGDGGDGGDAAAETVQDFDQTNVNQQVGEANAQSSAESVAVSDGDGQAAGADDPKDKGAAEDFAGAGAESTAVSDATAVVDQNQNVNQGNSIDADATTVAEGGDGGDGGDAGVGVDIDF